jgi:hypothetical protein
MKAPLLWDVRVKEIEHGTIDYSSFNFNTQLLPPMQRQLLQWVQKDPAHLCIAGGVALGMYTDELQHIGDWDIFAMGNWGGDVAAAVLRHKLGRAGFKRIGRQDVEAEDSKSRAIEEYTWKNGVYQEIRVQLIQLRAEFSSAHEVFEVIRYFDFTPCMVAVCGEHYYLAPGTRDDIYWRRLSFNHTPCTRSTEEKRLQRYIQKGYTPDDDFMQDMKRFYAEGRHWTSYLRGYHDPQDDIPF